MAVKFLSDISTQEAIQFKNASGSNAGKIDQVGDNLVISNAVGDILFGDTNADVYIGDGVNSVDVLFEQSGSIKAEDGSTGVTLTLGSADTSLSIYAPTITNLSAQNSEATSLMINSSGVVGTRELGSLAFSSATYDNYGSWNLKTGGTQRTTVGSGGTLDIVGGTNVTATYSAGGVVTLASTDTWLTNTNARPGIVASGANQINKVWKTDESGNPAWRDDSDTVYSTATSSTLGLVKIGYTENGKNYPVELSSGKMFVNVPWTDNNTTYSNATTSADGLMSSTDKTKLDGIATGADVTPSWVPSSDPSYLTTSSAASTYATSDHGHSDATTSSAGFMSSTDKTKLDGIAASANNYSLPAGSSTVRGGFKIGYAENGKNYPVEVSSEKMFVNVPWTDNNTTYSAGTNISLSGSTFNLNEFIDNAYPYQNRRWGNSNGVYMPAVKGGLYATNNSSVTGRLQIKLPHYKAAIMQSFVIDVYEYDTDRFHSYIVSGYTYNDTNATWYNTSAIAIQDSDNRNLNVRFGSDETNDFQCVSIGETSTSWSYPQVVVRDYMGGYDASNSEVLGEWEIAFVTTDTATYDITHSTNHPIVASSRISGSVAIANGGTGATTAAGARTNLGAASTSAATTSANGLMSSTDKSKLDGIDTGADVTPSWVPSSDPSYLTTSSAASTYATTDHGHSDATTSSAGFMSSTDKTKLDGIAASANNYSLPTASSTVLGGIKVGTNLSISNGVLSATDTDTWVSNTNARAGYVASGAGQANKVWKTDESGNPAWREDSDTNTNYYVSGLSFATGTGVLTATVSGATNQTVDLDGRYLELGGGTMTGNIILGSNKIAADTTSPTAHIQVGAGTTNTGNRSDVALLGESNSGGIANALGLVNTASGTNSNGVALNFHNGNAWSPTGQIITRQNSSGTATDSAMQFYTYSGGLNHRMSIKSDGTIRFNAYGAGLISSDANGNLSVDTSTYLTGVPSKSVGIAELDVTDGSSGQVLTTDGNGTLSFSTVSAGGSNYYLDGITRTSGTNTLVFSVSGTTNQSYTFGSNAFTSYTDHSTQGYLTTETYTAHENTSDLSGIYGDTANGTKIDTITVDANGHITAITTGATGNMTGFYVEDGDGTEVQINNANEWKFVEGGGIDINWTDTSTGSDTDPYDLTFSIAANGVSATQLNVVGDGTSGQVLTSDGDGTFSWTNKTTNTNTVTSVGVSGSETTGTVTLAGSGATTVSQEGSTITIDSTNTQYSNATTSAAGLMSSTDKTKLDGIATNADVTPSWVPATDPGYLTAHPAITEATTNLSNSGRTYIQSITLDSNGHVTGVSTGTETVTNTNTTYSAGSGLDLSSTTFSVEADLRDGITHVGKDTSNYITFDSTNGRIDFYAGGVFVARMESDGDLHVKGDVIAFSSIFA